MAANNIVLFQEIFACAKLAPERVNQPWHLHINLDLPEVEPESYLRARDLR